MAYKRKTRDCWDIMTNWGQGWEYEYRAYTAKEAYDQLKIYIKNVGTQCAIKLEKHREKLITSEPNDQ